MLIFFFCVVQVPIEFYKSKGQEDLNREEATPSAGCGPKGGGGVNFVLSCSHDHEKKIDQCIKPKYLRLYTGESKHSAPVKLFPLGERTAEQGVRLVMLAGRQSKTPAPATTAAATTTITATSSLVWGRNSCGRV